MSCTCVVASPKYVFALCKVVQTQLESVSPEVNILIICWPRPHSVERGIERVAWGMVPHSGHCLAHQLWQFWSLGCWPLDPTCTSQMSAKLEWGLLTVARHARHDVGRKYRSSWPALRSLQYTHQRGLPLVDAVRCNFSTSSEYLPNGLRSVQCHLSLESCFVLCARHRLNIYIPD